MNEHCQSLREFLMKNFIFLSCFTFILTNNIASNAADNTLRRYPILQKAHKTAVQKMFYQDFNETVKGFLEKHQSDAKPFQSIMLLNQNRSVTVMFVMLSENQRLGIEKTYTQAEIKNFYNRNKNKPETIFPYPFNIHFEVIR